MLLKHWRRGYQPLDAESSTRPTSHISPSRPRHRLIAILFALALFGGYLFSTSDVTLFSTTAVGPCLNPSVRREWRTLSPPEKAAYTTAVNCLRMHPSRFSPAQTLYDDFPNTHVLNGASSHASAMFLPWHRYFLHLYEQALRQDCGYTGPMAFWDWTLDWVDLGAAPVWEGGGEGFGGDGAIDGRGLTGLDGELQNGRDMGGVMGAGCVADGKFGGLLVKWLGPLWRPHCLSRGFAKGEMLGKLGRWNSPEAVDKILEEERYEDFLEKLEKGPHMAVPKAVGGDFMFFTAPYDPVFLLHHAQLDRLWWLWQNRNPEERISQYGGLALMNSSVEASLGNRIQMGGLAKGLKVRDVMDTHKGPLCYNY